MSIMSGDGEIAAPSQEKDPRGGSGAERTNETPEALTISKACAYGNIERVKELLAESTSISFLNQPDADGYYPLQWAALNNRDALMEFLLENGARIDNKDTKTGQSAFHWAAVTGADRAVDVLMRAGADPLDADCKGYTPLHIAAQYGQTAMVYALATRYKAPVDVTDGDGRSALHWAAYKGNEDICKLLLVMDAKVNRTDSELCTPLHWAAIRGYAGCLTTLVHGGGGDALSMPEVNGQTPEDLARDKGHAMVVGHLRMFKEQIKKRKHRLWGQHGQLAWLARLDMSWFVWSQYMVMNGILWFLVKNSVSLPPPSPLITRMCYATLAVSITGMVLLYQTTFSDPGFVPVKLGDLNAVSKTKPVDMKDPEDARRAQFTVQASPALRAGQWGQLCVSCRLVRPLRAKHCAVNDRCVEVFDHYCPWVGNTIGKKNRHIFCTLLVVTALSLLLGALTGALRLREGAGGLRSLAGGFWIILFVAWMCVLLLSTTAIIVAQVQSLLANVTTNEMSNWHRYSHMKHPRTGTFFNPFDRGWSANLVEAFTPWRQPMMGVTLDSPGPSRAENGHANGGVAGERAGTEGTPLLGLMPHSVPTAAAGGHRHGPHCRHGSLQRVPE